MVIVLTVAIAFAVVFAFSWAVERRRYRPTAYDGFAGRDDLRIWAGGDVAGGAVGGLSCGDGGGGDCG